MEEFRENEIRSVKFVRAVYLSFVLILNFAAVGVWSYKIVTKYIHGNPQLIFYGVILIIGFQIIMIIALFFPYYLIHRQCKKFIDILKIVDNETLNLYLKYTKTNCRLYTKVPEYLLLKKQIIIFNIMPTKPIDYAEIISMETFRMRQYRGAIMYIAVLKTFKKKYKIQSNFSEKIKFAVDHILIKNPEIILDNRIP